MPTSHPTGGAAVPSGHPAPAHSPSHASHPGHPAHHAGQPIYPYTQLATADFHTAPRYFRAPRPGRLHAAVDLWAPWGRPIHAVADGTVLMAPYYFYLGTNALEVLHPGLGHVRYGEISIVKHVPLRAGQRVKQGEVIAYVGQLDGLSYAMLHFELYSGAASGPLTVVSNPPFERRRDLLDPTHVMERMQALSFPR